MLYSSEYRLTPGYMLHLKYTLNLAYILHLKYTLNTQ